MLGCFGSLTADHPAATRGERPRRVDRVLALPEAKPPAWPADRPTGIGASNLFTSAPLLDALDLDDAGLDALFDGDAAP